MNKYIVPKLNFANNEARLKCSRQSYTTSIEVSRFGDRTAIAVILLHRRRIVDSSLLLVGSESPERAWQRGYCEAQRLADLRSPGARLFIYEEKAKAKQRRVAA